MATVALPQNQFDNVIRYIKRAEAEKVEQLEAAVLRVVREQRLRTRHVATVSGVPAGSDQFDAGSLVTWLSKVRREDGEAAAQVKQIAATAAARLRG